MNLFLKLKNSMIITFLFMLILSSCTVISISNKNTRVIAEKDKPFCDIKKLDPNCKVEGNYSNL